MKVNIGKIIKDVVVDSEISVSGLARKIGCSRQNIYGIFKRKSIDTAMLLKLRKNLGYDFFKHFDASLEVNSSPKSRTKKA